MSDLFDTLQEQYQALVIRKERREKGESESEETFLEDVRTFITNTRQAGATVADLNERSQLRAWMRFLANVLYDATGVYPDITLQPLASGQLVGPQPPEYVETPSSSFPLAWMLVGGAAAIIIAVGLVTIGWISNSRGGVEPTQLPTPASTSIPVPFVSRAVVGAALGPSGALEVTADTFCLGTPEIVAELAVEGIEPEMMWRWEVQRNDEIVASQSAAPWGSETQPATTRILTGGREGVEPGRYEMLVYVGEQVVGAHSFQVLDTPPRVFNLRIADVPEPTGAATDGDEFEAGARVIYLNYEYEGLCPNLDISHVLYREGESIQEIVEPWNAAPQGQMQVSFQAPGDQPFSPGDYEVAVAMAEGEQSRGKLTIRETPSGEVPPAFGDITIALGVQPSGQPILAVQDSRLDWNTKVVYAIFDYVGMRGGLRWLAVWTRNDQEVAREEHFWDVESDGTEGTLWVTYHVEQGRTLSGGNYSVRLYIENIAQSQANFDVTYYTPR
ncbi:MAG: hypothetical protein SXV54_20050 [Chloroflexota bacterium]|nr:hypothetical protein [Chloroflexota bacterium]